MTPVAMDLRAGSAAALAPLQAGASPLAGVPLRLLDGALPQAQTWQLGPVQAEGRHGALHWQHDGQRLRGALAVDEDCAQPEALAGLVRDAYLDLFGALQAAGFHQPLRLWNYLPRINAEQAGLERYRHFNQGRQQAFVQAGQSAFEGAPTACALGTPEGPLCIRVLAARAPAVPLENPRQVSAYHYPPAYGPRSPSFSRAALVEAAAGQVQLLVSGTASIVGHATVHAGDLLAQVRETMTNLSALIDAARARCSADFSLHDLALTAYVRHAGHAPQVRAELARLLGPDSPALRQLALLQADICRADLLVEIEAHAQRAGVLTR